MLTPIEKYNNIYFKRDDKFAPYGDVNGGKMRLRVTPASANSTTFKIKYTTIKV